MRLFDAFKGALKKTFGGSAPANNADPYFTGESTIYGINSYTFDRSDRYTPGQAPSAEWPPTHSYKASSSDMICDPDIVGDHPLVPQVPYKGGRPVRSLG